MTAQATRTRLMETAIDLFYRNGFQAVGLDQILDGVGITKTAFYKHFESKDDLIVAALDHRDRADIQEWETFMQRAADGDPRGQMVAAFDLLDTWFRDPEFRGCLFMNAATEFPSPADPIHKAAQAHSANMHDVLLVRARRARVADAPGLAGHLMMLIRGAITQRHNGGDLDAARKARIAAEQLIAAACGPEPR